MTNVNKNILNVTIKNVNKPTRGRSPKGPKEEIIACGRCRGSGRDMFTLDGNCPVCKGKGKVRV